MNSFPNDIEKGRCCSKENIVFLMKKVFANFKQTASVQWLPRYVRHKIEVNSIDEEIFAVVQVIDIEIIDIFIIYRNVGMRRFTVNMFS